MMALRWFGRLVALGVALAGWEAAPVLAAGDGLLPGAFAWRASVDLPVGSSVARVDLPADALLRLQSPQARDVRVFNAAGAVVPYALLGRGDLRQSTAPTKTAAYVAHALYAAGPTLSNQRGVVRVQVAADGGSAWVRWDSAEPTSQGAEPLSAVLLDTRGEMQTVSALELQSELPRNALVHIAVASSPDLNHWTDVPVQGPVFQFDGADAPSNNVLELAAPLALQGRYLRLSWEGQSGVHVRGITGRVAPRAAEVATVHAALPAATADGSGLTWSIGFATPIAGLHLQALQDNTLWPVRILGRTDVSQPWRNLASTVLYRLDHVGQGNRNSATPLGHVSVRALRVETSNGLPLPATAVQATLELQPVQLVFLASGQGPYTVVAGRADTPSAAVDAALIASVVGVGGAVASASPSDLWAKLPLAGLHNVQMHAAASDRVGTGILAGVPARNLWLWGVLLVGVLVLAGVAYGLLHQMSAKRVEQ